MPAELTAYERAVAEAIIGVDTLFGGDVNNPSGMGRFIADCYFSGKPLPAAYHDPLAAKLRESGGVGAKAPDKTTCLAYLAAHDPRGHLKHVRREAAGMAALRREYVEGLAGSLETMLDLVAEILGEGPKVDYARCVFASNGKPPRYSKTEEDRALVRTLLKKAGFDPATHGGDLLRAVDAWRLAHRVRREEIRSVSDHLVPRLDQMAVARLLPHLPPELHRVPRANIRSCPSRTPGSRGR